ncbi:MAG TPA: hypothetical protein VF275_08935 [Gammaproteobacteria bacterium]
MNENNGNPLSESRESLWWLVAGPSIWFAHFMLSYVTAAVWCAKVAEGSASLIEVRITVMIYTVLALTGIVATGWRGYRHHRYGAAALPHDDDTPADRHRFIGFATLLLCGLSVVATVYVALVAVFIGSCR